MTQSCVVLLWTHPIYCIADVGLFPRPAKNRWGKHKSRENREDDTLTVTEPEIEDKDETQVSDVVAELAEEPVSNSASSSSCIVVFSAGLRL